MDVQTFICHDLTQGNVMRKAVCFFIILVIQLIITSTAYSKKEQTISNHNEYGGKTEETLYEPNDSKYKMGISRMLSYYNKSNIITKIEYYYTDEHSKEDGIYRKDQIFGHNFPKGITLEKSEYYYTDNHSNVHGLRKTAVYYDNDGNTSKEEFFYTEAYAKRKVYSRIEVLYERGNPVKRVYYDKNDKMILTEDKKKVWKSD